MKTAFIVFDKKLRIAQYAKHSIYDYKLKIAHAALYLQKLPDDFTQDDVEGYLSSRLNQKRHSISFFKHTVFRLLNYYKVMELKKPMAHSKARSLSYDFDKMTKTIRPLLQTFPKDTYE